MSNNDQVTGMSRSTNIQSRVSKEISAMKSFLTPTYLLMGVLFLMIFYLIFLCVTHFSWWLLIEKGGIQIKHLESGYWAKYIIVFSLFFLPLLYLFASFIAKRFIRIHFSRLILYMGCTFFGAMWYEIILDTIFVKYFGQPGWLYLIWPVHGGYTSGVGMLMWPFYGFFIYCMNSAIEINPRLARLNNGTAKTFLYAVDAMALEIIVNFFSILFFHTYLFYYLADDLLHFTTIDIFIPYLFASGLGATLSMFIDLLKKNHFIVGLIFYLAGVVSLFWLC
jgi:hypothetical protein